MNAATSNPITNRAWPAVSKKPIKAVPRSLTATAAIPANMPTLPSAPEKPVVTTVAATVAAVYSLIAAVATLKPAIAPTCPIVAVASATILACVAPKIAASACNFVWSLVASTVPRAAVASISLSTCATLASAAAINRGSLLAFAAACCVSAVCSCFVKFIFVIFACFSTSPPSCTVLINFLTVFDCFSLEFKIAILPDIWVSIASTDAVANFSAPIAASAAFFAMFPSAGIIVVIIVLPNTIRPPIIAAFDPANSFAKGISTVFKRLNPAFVKSPKDAASLS